MNLSAWSIRSPIPAILLFALLAFMGTLSFMTMKVQQFMDIDLPSVRVVASLPGAAPALLETEVARKIENALATLQGIKHLYTKIQDGTATITAEFRLEKPTQEAVDDVRDAVARVRPELPGDLEEPIVAKINLTGLPILSYTVASPHLDEEALSWFVDNDLARRLLSVPGVGAVNRVGGVEREVRVELDPDRLLALRVTAAEISRQLRLIQREDAGGRADLGGAEQSIRTLATVQTAAELAELDISLSDGRRIRLGQVATLIDTVAERRSAALLDGRPVVGFEVVRSRGAGEVQVAQGVRAELARLQSERPDLEIVESFNFVDPVLENFEGSMSLLLEGALLAVLVVWVFLRDWRATLISATALPLSILPTFAAMHLLGFTLNVVTLLALSLVIGVLVDDAIVEIENILRHLRQGKTPYQAALEAADEIGLAVIATSFTLIAVFLPTAFMSGVAGKFFVQFGWTAAIAVFFSLVVARLLTPMMAAYLLRPPRRLHDHPRWLDAVVRLSGVCVRHRWLTLLGAAVFFVGAFALAPFLPTGFLPPDDMSQTQVYLELPPGSRLDETLEAAERARVLIARHPQVQLVYTTIGGGAAGSDPLMSTGVQEVRKATLTIRLSPRGERRGVSKQAIERELREALTAIPGIRFTVGLAGANEKYILVLTGEDGERLVEHARRVERELRTLPGIGTVTNTAGLARPELVVRPDSARAAELGVTTAAIAETLRIATSGDYAQLLPKLNLSQRQVPIVVRLPPEARQDLDLLRSLSVPGRDGPVQIGAITDLRLDSGPAEIDRYDRRRNVNFEIELNQQPLGLVEKQALALPSLRQLPPGISQTQVGDAEVMGELFASFGVAMLTGVLCIYAVLVLLFRDFVQPVTTLAALVLSIPGAFLALFVTGSALSMPSLIGLIMLMGIATKNSILLVDYILLARRTHGLNRWEALLDACRKRARPIIMTTVAMGAGMLPIALGIGVDPSFRAPMAIVVIGGLITSTFLSLLVVPVVYTLVDDGVEWARRLVRGGSKRSTVRGGSSIQSGQSRLPDLSQP